MTDNRARMANVLSIAQNAQRKKNRRERKSSIGKSVPAKKVLSSSAPAESKPTSIENNVEKISNARLKPIHVQQSQSNQQVNKRVSDVGFMDNSHLFTAKQLEQLGIVHPNSKNLDLVNALRQLRTKLFQLRPNGNFSVLVTSVVPEGGASFVALNLASTITFGGEKTSLLIDANVNTPVLHRILKLLKLKPKYGLLDYLMNPDIGIENIVSPSGIPRMRIIPIGETGDVQSEQLTSRKLPGFLQDVKERYDNRYIVVDAPCITESADVRVLADHCDYIVLVVPYGQVTPNQIETVIGEVDERKIAGIVLNNEPLPKM